MELEIHRYDRYPELFWTRLSSPLSSSMEREGLLLMTAEEEERYYRFSHIPSREMYLIARLFSKTLLGEKLGCPPDQIRFSLREGGKPYLTNHRELRFNISHSAGVVAFISSEKGETGVDVEEVRDRDCLNLARHFFSEEETKVLEGFREKERMEECFFEIWTQKEAYLKGTGKGLPGGLKDYTVPRISGDPSLGGFQVENFRPYPDVMGAMALSLS